ncbi:plasmid replication protein RepC [Bartonella sp. CB178]|uniref:plasmid replication protein RepC n=1 Tax=Bartonella sp. CB178 TaxID=3112255 RepID=UPI00300E1B4D
MVRKASGRCIGAHHIEYIKIADRADIGGVSRGQLISLVRQLPMTGLIKATEAQLLHVLLNTVSPRSFDKGGVPVVFKSNRRIGLEIGCSDVHTSRLLSRLFDKGLVVMRDSGNYKRFPVSSEGNVITACGIDLSILISRYHELQQLISETKEETRRQNVAARRFRGLCRQLQSCVALAGPIPVVSVLWGRVKKITNIIGSPIKASFSKLERAIRLLNWILSRLFFHKMLCKNNKNVMHIHNTNPYPISNCNQQTDNPSNRKKEKCTDKLKYIQKNHEISQSKKAYESHNSRSKQKTISSKNILPQIKSEIWKKAMPHTSMYLDNNINSIKDIVSSMGFLAKMLGISSNAVEQAKTTMGLEKAALAIGIILEKYSRQLIQSPGGYLRGMIARQDEGELHLERSIHGLLKMSEKNDM